MCRLVYTCSARQALPHPDSTHHSHGCLAFAARMQIHGPDSWRCHTNVVSCRHDRGYDVLLNIPDNSVSKGAPLTSQTVRYIVNPGWSFGISHRSSNHRYNSITSHGPRHIAHRSRHLLGSDRGAYPPGLAHHLDRCGRYPSAHHRAHFDSQQPQAR